MSSTSGWLRRLVVAGLLGLAVAAPAAPTSYADEDKPHSVFTIDSGDITESSSLVVSTAHPGLVYTTNDSGDGAIVYVLDAGNGDVVGRTALSGVDAVDIEALAGGSDGSLVVADIGDNQSERDTVSIYRIQQPTRGEREVEAHEVKLIYRDGPRDAESVLYDAESGRILVIDKRFEGAQVYQTAPDAFERSTAHLRPVAEAPPLATDAAFLRDGDFAVIRNYFSAAVYTYPKWEKVASVELPAQDQGESVAVPLKGDSIWIGSEGGSSQVLEVTLPPLTPEETADPASPPTPTPSSEVTDPATPETTSAADPELESLARIVLLASIGALLLVAAVAVFSRRRPSA